MCSVEESAVEICEFAQYFVKKFVPDQNKGDVLNYIKKILWQKIIHAGNTRYKLDKRNGIRISDNKTDDASDKLYRELMKICKKNDKSIMDKGVKKFLADQTGKTIKKIEEIINAHTFSVIGEIHKSSDGEDFSLLDLMTDKDLYKEFDSDREKQYRVLFEKLESCYISENYKKQKYISSLVTFNLLKEFEKSEESRSYIASLLDSFSFIDRELLDLWKDGKDIGTQKSIAQRFKPHLSDNDAKSTASRDFRSFLDKFKNG